MIANIMKWFEKGIRLNFPSAKCTILIMLLVLLSGTGIIAQILQKQKISTVLLEVINKDGLNSAIDKYRILKQTDSTIYDFREAELNNLGYTFLNEKKYSEAIEIFKLNIETYPDKSNCWNSLAEAYMLAGQRENASRSYQKNYELNPNNLKAKHLSYNLANYTKHEYDIPMRDGIRLKTIVYHPIDESQPYPFLLRRTPYGIAPYGENEFKFWLGTYLGFAESGFIFVYQDVRGKLMSEGDFIINRPFIVNKKYFAVDESTDTYDTIEWLLKNIPNNNGKVGMYGYSYPAFYALMGALSLHPALVAIAPQAPPADIFIGDDFHRNGAFYLLESVNYFRTNGVKRLELTTDEPATVLEYPSPDLYSFFLQTGALKNWNEKYFKGNLSFWNDMMKHGTYDNFWKEKNILPHLNSIKTAVLNVGGWYDAEDLYGPLNVYKSIEKKNNGIVNSIVMGPWFHGGWTRKDGNRLGEVLVESSLASEFYQKNIELPFFEYYLKGKGQINLPEALMYNTGLCKWDSLSSWPPKYIYKKTFYLGSNSILDEDHSTNTNEYDEFISDPEKPVPHSNKIENSWDPNFMISDQRFASSRPDVLHYQTQELNEDITIVGEIDVELYVSTTGTDADWFVKVIDVYPENDPDFDGISDKTHMGEYQSLVRIGVMRGKFRNSLERPEPFVPSEVTKVKFKLDDIYHTFKKGHKLMVQVQSSCFPLFDINPQKFVDIYNADENDFQKAIHRVFIGGIYQSKINVNVLL